MIFQKPNFTLSQIPITFDPIENIVTFIFYLSHNVNFSILSKNNFHQSKCEHDAPLKRHLMHLLNVTDSGQPTQHRRSFCDELCQLYVVIYKTRCPTLFHTEHHQSSYFCNRNENNIGFVIFCGDLPFHWYIGC